MRSLQALAALFACVFLPLHAAVLNDLTWTTTDGEVTITDCDETATGELVIPDSIEGNPVTRIGDYAFWNCNRLTGATIPGSVTSLGEGAFASCSSLTSTTIGDSVTRIGNYAFRDCSSLTSITIPNSVTSIAYSAFRDCSNLASIAIPDSVTEIGNGAFQNCGSLKTIEVGAGNPSYTGSNGVLFDKEQAVLLTYPAGKTAISYALPDSVTSIANDAFLNCPRLKDIVFGDNSLLANIGTDAFQNCIGLVGIEIPDSVTSIGAGSFLGCTSLASIAIGESVTSIGRASFAYCTSLTSITISDSVTSIGDSTFAGCTRLTSIAIPGSVTSIGYGAFSDCSSLASITLPDSVNSIGDRAFSGCASVATIAIPDGVTRIGNHTFLECTSLTSVTISDSVTSIGDRAFQSSSSLAVITLPDSVTSIGDRAFLSCRSLSNITFLGAAPTVGADAFSGVADGARAHVGSGGADAIADSFGGIGNIWEGLTVFASTRTIGTTIVTGSGSAVGGGTFITGSSVTLTATPDPGYLFIGWTGDATGSVNPLTLTIERDMNVGAIFTEGAGLVPRASYDAVVAERDARPTQAAYDAAVATARTDGQGDVIATPDNFGLITQAAYDAVVAERDALYTEDQIRALSPDYTMGLNEAGNVEVKISFIASSDATNFAPFSVTAESLSVVEGKICIELPPDQGAFFYRFRIE